MADGQMSVWASTEVRPDPFNLPAEYHAPITGRGDSKETCETIIVSRDEVSFSVGSVGTRVPMKQYLGVAMSVGLSAKSDGDEAKAAVMIILEHEDNSLSVPLFVAWDTDDVVAIWHAWARELGVPLRVCGADGVSNQINDQMGSLSVFPGAPRRASRTLGPKHGLTRTLRRSSSPLAESFAVKPVEKIELFARQ